MKKPKKPTLKEKQLLARHDLNVDNFMVIKNMPGHIEIVKRSDLKTHKQDASKIRIVTLLKNSVSGKSNN